MQRLGLALLIATAGCGRSGAPFGGDEYRVPLPRVPAFGAPGEIHRWNSWDVQIGDGGNSTVVASNGGIAATVTFYVSGASFSVQPGSVLDEWASVHPNGPQNAGPVVVESGDPDSFPYAAKNLTARTASDPGPLGVFDLQMHPRDDDRFVVMAFETPLPGHYVVSGFGARKVLGGGANVGAGIFLGSDPDVPESIISADNDMQWELDLFDTDLGIRPAGEHICFAVHRGLDSAVDDAAEVAFTITRTDE